jgi:hypothetical protein
MKSVNKKYYLFFNFLLITTFTLVSKRVVQNQTRIIYHQTIQQFMKQYPAATSIQVSKNCPFDYPEFPLYPEHKEKYFHNKGFFRDHSILEIPNGIVSISKEGFDFVNDIFITETAVKDEPFKGKQYITQPVLQNVVKVHGRVAVINHPYSSIYGIFICNILGRLALLEIANIEYDYLWIPYDHQYAKEALEIWGIDTSKIIPLMKGQVLQADTIIIATAVSEATEVYSKTDYYPGFLMKYIREKMLMGIQKKDIKIDLPEKVFISRKDASFARKIPNEDQVFALFEPLGYKRYEFSKLNMAEKIAVSYNAKHIVSFLGSGSTNILFTSPDVKFYEIFQGWVEATFFYIGQALGVNYICLNASTIDDLAIKTPSHTGRDLPLNLVEKFIQEHPEL